MLIDDSFFYYRYFSFNISSTQQNQEIYFIGVHIQLNPQFLNNDKCIVLYFSIKEKQLQSVNILNFLSLDQLCEVLFSYKVISK